MANKGLGTSVIEVPSVICVWKNLEFSLRFIGAACTNSIHRGIMQEKGKGGGAG